MDLEQLKKKPALILSGGGCTPMLADALRNTFHIGFMYQQVAQQYATREDMVVVNPHALLTPQLQTAALNEAIWKIRGLMSGIEDGSFLRTTERLFQEHGVSGEDLSASFPDWLPARVLQAASRNIARLKMWEKFQHDLPVTAVVTHEDVMEETKVMCLFFRNRGVPTIHVPHAVYLDLWRAGPGENLHDEINTDWIAAAGKFQRDWYIERGGDPRRIVITGLPQWDKWSKKQPGKEHARRALKLPEGKPIVTYASSWSQATDALGSLAPLDESYKAFLDASKADDWTGVVKLHPHAGEQNWKMHKEIADKEGGKVAMTAQYLDLVLAASDLVVAIGPSNILIEAAMLGIPCLSVLGFEHDEAIPTCSVEDTGKAISECLTDSWRAKFADIGPGFVEKYAYRNDGQALARVVGLLGKVTNGAGR